MTFLQSLRYFFLEASSNLIRSWKISLLAIMTIAVSVFLGGVFLIVSGNLRLLADQWRDENRLVVYLRPEASDEDTARIRKLIEDLTGTDAADYVDPKAAEDRFRSAFPSLADLLEGWGDQPLPASFEIRTEFTDLEQGSLEGWLSQLASDPAVQMVDDDRDWLAQLDGMILIIEGLASVVGVILLLTAVFTISSVIRLTAYLYQDEIAVMRLVGATEFFIRGPFYVEGLLQGLAGGVLALGMLLAGHGALFRETGGQKPVLASVLAESFLPTSQLLLLVALGAAAGLGGAVLSLRKESLGQTAEPL